jgi:hypothetical protein
MKRQRKLHNEEHHNLYSSPSIIRVIKSKRMTCSTGDKGNAYRTLVEKPQGKRSLGRPRRRWVDNTKIHFREIGWDRVDWFDMAQNTDQWRAPVNTVLKLRVP